MEDVTTLILQVSSGQVKDATVNLRILTNEARRTETATDGLMTKWKAFTGFLAGAAGLGTAIAGLRKLMDTAKQFESLEAQLKTATGSAENAAFAFQAIQDFASQTPYDLAQSTEAFIKLVNLGLTPSERALRSYGDTASAMGKDLSTMVQAVANATTGEFEILKQFGVKARTEADGISFSFRGTTTKVKNDARSIEEYFIALGEKNFGGAMAERMATLEGKLSNLGDAWDVLFATISKAGAGELMKEAIDLAISAVSELTDMIASGQLAGYTEALLFKFESLADGVYNAFNNISDVLAMSFEYWTTDGKGAVDFLIGAFKNLPENVRMYMRAVGANYGLIIGYAEAAWSGAWDVTMGYFNALIKTAENVGKEVWSHLSPTADDFDFIAAQKEVVTNFADTAQQAFKRVGEGIQFTTEAWEEEIVASLDARDAAIAGYESRIAASKKLREEYDLQKQARIAAGEGQDRLARFGVGTQGQTAEFQKLRESLRTQAQVLEESHLKRRTLILDNTKEDLALQEELLTREQELYTESRKKLLDDIGADVDVRSSLIADANALELQQLEEQYAEKQRLLEEALAAKVITEEEYQRRSEQMEKRHVSAVSKVTNEGLAGIRAGQLENYGMVLGMAGDIASQIEQIAQKSGKGAKAAFYAARAISIAQAIVYTELAAIRALAEGGAIAGIPLSTAIRALGYTSVGLMTATTIAGYEDGGIIPGNSFSGDRVPARVNSGEMILNYGQQKKLFDMANGKGSAGGGGNVTLIVNNQGTATEATVTGERDTEDGKVIELMLKQVETRVSNGIKGGGTPVSRAIESTYNLRRGGGAAP